MPRVEDIQRGVSWTQQRDDGRTKFASPCSSIAASSSLMVEREGQKVLDNGGLRSAARNPTRDDLCDLDNDDDDDDDDDEEDDGPAPPSHLIPLLRLPFSTAHEAHSLGTKNLSLRKVRNTASSDGISCPRRLPPF
uniref:Uncharacterized protein n=1 Tax=Vespula pensylvanica TaxID=30213 RepID=A0A834U488_VESPE|nr:hypothetical protein H0235_012313 [Vespula pensylvanica]